MQQEIHSYQPEDKRVLAAVAGNWIECENKIPLFVACC